MTLALVTGAGGFIGCHVVRRLLEKGFDVRAMLAPGENPQAIQGLNVETINVDLRDSDAVHNAVRDCHSVFHLAAIYAVYLDRPQDMYDVNVGGTRHIMAACAAHNVHKVVHTSSIAAVGLRPNQEPATEAEPFKDFTIQDDYVLSKYISEQEALSWATKEVPVVSVNPGFPFGPFDYRPTPTGRMIAELLLERLPGYFDGGLSAVDVEDVAAGHLLAAEHGQVGERYLLSGTNISYEDFIRQVARSAGVKPSGKRLPLPLARLVAHAFVIRKRLLGIEPLMTPGLLSYSARHLYYDHSRAKNELGWETTPFQTTIEKTIDFFQEQIKSGAYR